MNFLKTLFQSATTLQPALLPEVARDFPEINHLARNDWRTVTLLRRWAYRHVRRALSRSCLLDMNESFGYYNKDAPGIFEAFRQELGGVWCGGAAHALMMLYRHFGFVSHSLDMGVAVSQEFPGLTHVVTLVEIDHRGKTLLSVQDGYFNISYVDRSSGEPLDYFDLLTRLAQRQHERIAIARQAAETKVSALIEPGAEPAPQIIWSLNRPNYDREITSTGLMKQSIEFTFDLFAQRSANFIQFKSLLIEQDYPPEEIYLLHFPFAVYGKHPDADPILQKAHSIISSRSSKPVTVAGQHP